MHRFGLRVFEVIAIEYEFAESNVGFIRLLDEEALFQILPVGHFRQVLQLDRRPPDRSLY